jgi:hypothetical protein
MSDLLSLISRLEAAKEGAREMDAEIMFDLYAKPVGKHSVDSGPTGYLWPENNPSWAFGHRFPGKDRAWFATVRDPENETLLIERDGALVLMNSLRVPHLTSSVDAALSLVPEGYAVEGMGIWPGHPVTLTVLGTHRNKNGEYWHGSEDGRWRASGATPALALCIASLRARATT